MGLFESYEKKCQQTYDRVMKAGERKARSVSDEELRRYSNKVNREGNKIGMEIARKEMQRRNMH